ncbi:MAG: phosphate signaling complex protein PhoU, partial [Planctomycetes bacterium]|nr:phosphate signaling complex protein PhoU [Planctomycetota bacterium]
MPVHLRRDLDEIKKLLLEVGSLVEEATNKAITALLDRREDLASEVQAGDREIDLKEVLVEELCLKLLALHQPVAADLRFVVVVMKVNNDLERMGDLAANIAERAACLITHPPLAVPLDFRKMAEKARAMVRDSLDCLLRRDTRLARAVLAADDEVDACHREMWDTLQQTMLADPATIRRALHYLSASRHLERIADLTTNIAEDVIYMVDG